MNSTSSKTLVVLCEHASYNIPEEFNNLELPESIPESHIGYDPGAAELAEYIVKYFNCKLFKGSTSRLLIDLNRSPEDKDIIPQNRCNIDIPGNSNIKNDEKEKRLSYYNNFHEKVKSYIQEISTAGKQPVILSIHSFSPEYFASCNEITSVDCGLLFNKDERLADSLYKAIEKTEFNVKKNQPYSLKEYKTGGVIKHGENNNYPYIGLELPYNLLIKRPWREKIAEKIILGMEKFLQC